MFAVVDSHTNRVVHTASRAQAVAVCVLLNGWPGPWGRYTVEAAT